MNIKINTIKYGYFSEKQHLICRKLNNLTRLKDNKCETRANSGYNIWLTDDGREVKTSEVTSTRNDDYMKSLWPDTIYLGRLVKWLKYVRYDSPPYLWKFDETDLVNTIENVEVEKVEVEKVETKFIPVGSGLNAVRKRR